MENKSTLFYFSSILLLSYLIAETSGWKKSEALSHIYTSKLRKSTSIDRSQFNVNTISVEEKLVHTQEGLKENDFIEKLPGQPEAQFKQYGGYVTVDPTAGRAFYYYFVEAHESAKSLPLLLWLNGGPGCSSLGFGAMEELGPFRVHSDGKTLEENKFSWNLAANLLFLESPAGVGFSYSNTTVDFVTGGDRRTAIDNYVFLLKWLERFPEYKNREFYISGESYAGHYAPQLAQIILFHNQKGNNTIINLQGIIIGNGAIHNESDAKGMYQYLASHAIISDETLDHFMNYCDFSPNSTEFSNECKASIIEAEKNIDVIDIYNIYAPKCSNSSPPNEPKMTSEMSIDPCIDNHVHAYLNMPEVQQALHANITKIPYEWTGCSRIIRKWQDSSSTVPVLKYLIANGQRVWLYSGDMDGRVPFPSTKLAIEEMKLPPITSWLPWFVGEEVGGYTQVYEGNLTFATVRGAGHQVPSYQPARALSLVRHFLAGKELPKSKNNTITSIPN